MFAVSATLKIADSASFRRCGVWSASVLAVRSATELSPKEEALMTESKSSGASASDKVILANNSRPVMNDWIQDDELDRMIDDSILL